MLSLDENARFHGRNVEKNTSFLLGMQNEGAPHLTNTIFEKVIFHDLRWLLASYHSPCNNTLWFQKIDSFNC